MIDIHMHILPGVDDGAMDLDESLQMADIAVQGGVHVAVATPHTNLTGLYENYYSEQYEHNLRRFRQALEREQIPLTVLRGMEVYTTRDVADRIIDGDVIPINHSKYYLMEFDFQISLEEMEKRLDRVLRLGFFPVIAHPERYDCIQDTPEVISRFMQRGCLAQINKASILRRFGPEEKRTADWLLQHGLVTCVASDAHTSGIRSPYMGEVQEYLESVYSYDHAKELLYDNPKKIITNQKIPFSGWTGKK